MKKTLTRSGNSVALVISKEMKAHLGLISNEIEVQYRDGSIVLTRPQSFEEALAETNEQYGQALKNLAK